MIYHIVTGDVAAAPLAAAIATEPSMEGEVIVMKDVLSVGPLQKEEGQKFSDLRSAFWQQVVVNEKHPIQVDDLERLSDISIELSKNEDAKVWLWIAPWPADICTYHWVLKYLGTYTGRFFVVNIAGLPFLDEQGKIFFPKSIGDIQPRELVKARKLARPVTPAELEVDGEEWSKLVKENGGIRTHEGGKRLISKNETHYDNQLISFCSQQYQKASKVVGQALAKFNIPTGDLYLGWRLRKIAETEVLQLQGDPNKGLKDFDVKLPSGLLEFGDEPVQAAE
ncbi:MAG: hypothetical protein JWQ38_2908 [Flavipsychrobacter sp.]|nr:hypothetical protein [Flavipsychrobacter sp.]